MSADGIKQYLLRHKPERVTVNFAGDFRFPSIRLVEALDDGIVLDDGLSRIIVPYTSIHAIWVEKT